MNREDTQLSARKIRPPAAWPFFVADAILVVMAALVIHFSEPGNRPLAIALAAGLLTLGVLVFIAPYLLGWYAQVMASRTRREQTVAPRPGEISAATERLETVLQRADEVMAKLSEKIEKAEGLASAVSEKNDPADNPSEASNDAENFGERFETFLQERTNREEALSARIEELSAAVVGLRERIETRERNAPVRTAPPTPPEAKNGGEVSFSAEAVEEERGPAKTEPETKETPAKTPARPKKNPVRKELDEGLFSTTTLLATAYIGAGNKLFVRGEGPGLSWEKGVPMQFLEIGRWGWTTSEAKKPFRLRLYKNDAEPDSAGEYILEPESSLEVRPEF